MSTSQNLKRRAHDSDEEAPSVKQPRVSVRNTHARRLPPLRRSDTQVLDVNASRPVIQHLPPPIDPVLVDPSYLYRDGDQDMAGSTEEESQDEAGAWDRRAKAHRHAALYKRPREAPKIKPRVVAQTISEVALLESSDSEGDECNVKILPTSDAILRLQKLAALRAERAAADKILTGSKSRAVSRTTASAAPEAPSSTASSSTSTTTKVTARSVSRASSRTSIATSVSVSQRVQEIDEIASSCPSRAPGMRSSKLAPVRLGNPIPKPAVARPQRKNSRAHQTAIDAIARSNPANPSTLQTRQRLTTKAPLASQPSAILRRSRRLRELYVDPESQ
ncbi:hypothetical protein RhiLY_01978 [Ceratobasidium sp. AG-Ba]|nr:hypothetical protein RhiLY_01978 [Ceratobasidium sp. AG-Ba]